MSERSAVEIQADRRRVLESVEDAVAVSQQLPEPHRSLALPAIISAVITAKSLGGLLKRLFGVSNRDLPYTLTTDTYPIAATAAAAGAQSSSNLTITQDSDFYAKRWSIVCGDDGTGDNRGYLQIIRLNNGLRLFSPTNGVHILPYRGTGLSTAPPFVLPQPLFFPRNTSAQIIITAITANAVGPVYFQLDGLKAVDVSSLNITNRRYGGETA